MPDVRYEYTSPVTQGRYEISVTWKEEWNNDETDIVAAACVVFDRQNKSTWYSAADQTGNAARRLYGVDFDSLPSVLGYLMYEVTPPVLPVDPEDLARRSSTAHGQYKIAQQKYETLDANLTVYAARAMADSGLTNAEDALSWLQARLTERRHHGHTVEILRKQCEQLQQRAATLM